MTTLQIFKGNSESQKRKKFMSFWAWETNACHRSDGDKVFLFAFFSVLFFLFQKSYDVWILTTDRKFDRFLDPQRSFILQNVNQ